MYSCSFQISKLNNLKVIHDLFSQCLTQIFSKTSSFTKPDEVLLYFGYHIEIASKCDALRPCRPMIYRSILNLRGRNGTSILGIVLSFVIPHISMHASMNAVAPYVPLKIPLYFRP
jgi:hypothetical protein